jgi:hypothetical protein
MSGFESAESSSNSARDDANLELGNQNRTFTCEICLDDSLTSLWPLSCGHAYCRECIESHVKTLVSIGDVYRVNCPTPTCRQPLTMRDIEFVCCADVTASYRLEKKRIDSLRSRDVVPCATPDCAGLLTKAKSAAATMRHCDLCGRDTCLKCMEQHDIAAKCDATGGSDWKVRFENGNLDCVSFESSISTCCNISCFFVS